ncbi:hypothetical protein DPMN_091916 [Dreissena polymorpha]|uniref:Uncharacterized protein n=1 Tax=Dreissena polymorpha TaxID=45954 RepID=A0A9D4L194_DREPO|nr:hypothetical protein DPMN_091916 [Dreissena polymorpha]
MCRAFEKDKLDIEIVNVSVQSTVDTLINMKDRNGAELEKIYNAIVDSRYKNVKVTDNEQNRMGFQTASTSYLETLIQKIQNTNDRFEEESIDKLQLANRVQYPKHLHTVPAEIYGKNAVEDICKLLGACDGEADGQQNGNR